MLLQFFKHRGHRIILLQMHLGEQARPDSSTLLVVLPPSRDASSVEEVTLLRQGTSFCQDLQVAVLPFRAIRQGFSVL